MKERQNWLDVVKGLGIIFIVLGHVTTHELFNYWIYSFHLPLFFFVAGWLMEPRTGSRILSKQYILTKAERLLLPFVEYRILLVLWWLLIERHFRELDLGPIWFLPTLFLATMLIAAISRRIPDRKRSIGFLAAAILLMVAAMELHALPYTKTSADQFLFLWIVRAVCGTTWMAAGICARKLLCFRQDKITLYLTGNFKKACVVLVLAAASIVLALSNGKPMMYHLQFGKSYILYYLSGICGIGLMFLLSCWWIRKNRVLEYLGRKSIVIMAFHEPIRRIVLKINDVMFGYLNLQTTSDAMRATVLGSLIISCITIVFTCILILVLEQMKRRIPENTLTEKLFAFLG